MVTISVGTNIHIASNFNAELADICVSWMALNHVISENIVSLSEYSSKYVFVELVGDLEIKGVSENPDPHAWRIFISAI